MGLAVGDTSKGQTLAAEAAQTPTPGMMHYMMHPAHQDNSASKGQTLAAEAAGNNRHGQQQGGSGYPAQLFAEFAGPSPLGARARRGGRRERAVPELTPEAKPGLMAAVILAPLLSRSLAL